MKSWSKKNKIVIPTPDAGNLGGVFACGSFIFILIDPKQEHWSLVDTIVHESVHVFQKAMEYIQEPLPGSESQAYHIADITVNTMKDFHALSN